MSDSPEVYTDEDGCTCEAAALSDRSQHEACCALDDGYRDRGSVAMSTYRDPDAFWVRTESCTCNAFFLGPGGHESGCGWVEVSDV